MAFQTTPLNQEIRQYLKDNPHLLRSDYAATAAKFKVTAEVIRHQAKAVRKEAGKEYVNLKPDEKKESKESEFSENFESGEASYNFTTKTRIKTLQDLIDLDMLDLVNFKIISYQVTTWEGYRSGKTVNTEVGEDGLPKHYVKDNGGLVTETLYRVAVKLQRLTTKTDLGKQRDILISELRSYSPKPNFNYSKVTPSSDKTLLEICLFDNHFGKLSWSDETGEDFDIKIAEDRFKYALNDLLSNVNLANVEKIMIPIGNDLINIDNRFNMTTAGTPQDTDSRYMKIIKTVKRILVEVITDLSMIAPIDVVIVPGNHDTTTSFMMGEILDAFFWNNDRVEVFNSAKLRKYYKYGKVAIQLSHGNEEKHAELGQIFATEEKQMWADTDFHFCQIGHFHKNKTLKFVSIDEFQGFQVQTIPSLSGTDAWHYKKGYNSMKQGKCFVFHPTKGLKGEYTVTI